MSIAVVPLATYEPDRARYAPNASDVILNARPVADGWGPLPSLEIFTEALAAEPRGLFTATTPAGTTDAFVGTAAAIYNLESDGTWTDVKSGAYSLPTGDNWSFTLFGSRVIVTNSADGVEYWDIGSSSAFATLSGSPPAAKHAATVGDFVVLGNIAGTPNKIVWSGLANSTQWTSGEELSDSQTFLDGGAVQGIIPIKGGGLVFQENVIRSMQYVPESGYTFAFTYANEKRGVIAPNSIVKIGPGDFVYLSRDGFFRGLGTPIGAEKVDDTFKALVDPSELENVEGSADPISKIVWFRFKTVSGTYQLLGYNWELQRWFQSDTDVRGLGVMATSAVSLEDLDTLYPGGMDSVALNTDSNALSGGTPAFAGFNSDYKMGFFTGLAQAATLETASLQLNPNGRAFVRGAEVVGDLGVLIGSDPSFTIEVGSSDYHAATETFKTAANPSTRTGIVPLRDSGRMHRFRINIAFGSGWENITAVRARFAPEGDA